MSNSPLQGLWTIFQPFCLIGIQQLHYVRKGKTQSEGKRVSEVFGMATLRGCCTAICSGTHWVIVSNPKPLFLDHLAHSRY